jgi:ribosome biogenesis protein YTM1
VLCLLSGCLSSPTRIGCPRYHAEYPSMFPHFTIHPLTLNYHHRHFVTASYDGHLRIFDYSQNPLLDISVHQAPITSVCVVPSPSAETEARILASSSHDLTACLTRISLDSEGPSASTVASLHLHTSPLSSISTDASGSHLLTSSWDGLIGVWDTSIPSDHQVPLDRSDDRKKRRRIAPANIKRKAPIAVLKSHTARVSKALFATGEHAKGKAYSCSFDSTVRTWDVESGVCINTIVSLVFAPPEPS